MDKQEVVDLMRGSKTVEDWNTNCDTVKAAHDGAYPGYWFATFIMSGLMASLGLDDQIHVTVSGGDKDASI